MNYYTIASFVIYLFAMLGIGFLFSGKIKNMDDYYLGGRRMNKWVVALSAQASDMSGWLLMGLPGAVFVSGFSEAWIGIGLGIGTYLNWKIVAHRLRQYSKICGDSITIPDFICNRFRDKSGISRTVAALIILVFFLFYTASGFVSAAKLFQTMFGMRYSVALWLGAAVVVSYTLLGGYLAVSWTDFIQGTLMFAAIVLVPACVVAAAGGFSATVDSLNEINPYLQSLFTSAKTAKATGMIGLVSCMAWGLGYFGMPHILVRFMSIANPAEVKGSRRIAMAWVFISLGAAVVIGLVGHLFLRQHPGVILDDPEKIFMVMINTIFANGVVAKLFAGILLSAIMAAIMSTADSQLLVSASAFTNDIYKKVVRRDASNNELVAVSRCSVAVVAVIAAVMASNTESEFFKVVMKMVSFAWGGFGAAFGPVILLALFWKRVNLPGAVAGMVVGAATCFIWKFYLAAKYAGCCQIFNLYELAPGFLLSLLTIVFVSLLTRAPSKEITDEFDAVDAAA